MCFVVYSEPIEIVWRYHLSLYLSHYPIRDVNPSISAINGNITSTETIVMLRCQCPIYNGQQLKALSIQE